MRGAGLRYCDYGGTAVYTDGSYVVNDPACVDTSSLPRVDIRTTRPRALMVTASSKGTNVVDSCAETSPPAERHSSPTWVRTGLHHRPAMRLMPKRCPADAVNGRSEPRQCPGGWVSCQSFTTGSSRLRRAKTVGKRACCPIHRGVVLEPAHGAVAVVRGCGKTFEHSRGRGEVVGRTTAHW